MGGAVSAGEDNDDLTENLVEANYIRSKEMAGIFKAVDRGLYYVRNQRSSAYMDRAWKFEHLHMSAPCIYSEVMEHLDLQPGMSFLNLGSGTGYLSTMAGLMLGRHGINHGIEIYSDVVEYAEKKLEEFMQKAPAFDRFEFCPPQFEVGNCLLLPPETPGYDRVYCGAGCPPQFARYLMNLLNIGGKLVVPLQDQLQIKTRTSELEWDSNNALGVSFADLIAPESFEMTTKAPPRNPVLLQDLCRFSIRQAIRETFTVKLPLKKVRDKKERTHSTSGEMKVRNFTLRRRRNHTMSDSTQSTHRRRVNTLGESDDRDMLETSDPSPDYSEIDEGDIAEPPGAVYMAGSNGVAENKDVVSVAGGHVEAFSSEDSIDDLPENGKQENSMGEELRRASNSNNISDSVPRSQGRNRRKRFRFFRSTRRNRTHSATNGPSTSASSAGLDGNDGGNESEDAHADTSNTDQDATQPHQSVSLLRLLQARIVDIRRTAEENSLGQPEEETDADSNPDTSSDEIFEPLIETYFTMAIRRLPLPPKLIKFLLYNRQ